jgi:regulator of sigma E protease
MVSIIIFLIILAALVLVHEFGHFIVAKKSGIRVDEFGLGFPPKIWAKKFGETTYTLNSIPFGGFVKIFGENPDDESINGTDSKRSFVNKPKYIQIAVLAAGVVFNVVFAWILISIGFSSGILASVADYQAYNSSISDVHVAVIAVNKNTPADAAGIKVGDAIVSLTTQKTKAELKDKSVSVTAIQAFIASHAQEDLIVHLKRGNELVDKTVTPKEGIVPGRVAIGIAMDDVGMLKLPFHLALYEGGKFTGHLVVGVTKGLMQFIGNVFKGKADLSSVSGPVGIIGLVGDATKLGFTYLLSFTALISINLAVINLMPFPALDGGRILFVIIEAIIRRPIAPKIANRVNAIGFTLLLILMLVITFKDIWNLF